MYTYYLLDVISISTQEVLYRSALVTFKTLMKLIEGFIDEEDDEEDTDICFKITQSHYDKPFWWIKDDID